MFDLHGRVAVVTGASSGLGVQMASAFAKQGADLVILARRKEKLEKVAEDIKALGVRCLPIQCDVTDTEAVNKAAEEAYNFYGKIDILVNNAGAAKNAGVLKMTDEEWDFTLQADLTSVFKVTRAFAQGMIKITMEELSILHLFMDKLVIQLLIRWHITLQKVALLTLPEPLLQN